MDVIGLVDGEINEQNIRGSKPFLEITKQNVSSSEYSIIFLSIPQCLLVGVFVAQCKIHGLHCTADSAMPGRSQGSGWAAWR